MFLEQILGKFKADGLYPDLKAYKIVLKCLEEVEQWDACIEVYDQMKASGLFSFTTFPWHFKVPI